MRDFEKLGAFYLGRLHDPESGRTGDELLLYDSKDLTTHALCVGMTGSGKTGLCVSLLEEAVIDGIPALAIDPKGDLGNLLLAFPELRPADFRPWVDPAEAAGRGLTPDALAAETAETWRKGLAEWGEDGARIARYCDAAERALYTPGSRSGRPLRVLRSLSAPPSGLSTDPDALGDRIQGAVSGLLSLVGIEADPLRSREQILLSNLVDRAWSEGRDLELPALIAGIQQPPFASLGVMDLEAFFPAKERFDLAMRLNHLLASPGFGAWMEGEPLDVGRLLYTDSGRPRLSILSIAHLSDRERMFVVTLVLSELISWMRSQPGTSSLRAILYMDEIFGYFPPSANPPSKTPMLTLLKQARAHGLGVVLATQNPVDLDYKGLSNAGTWFVGRLQAERDKARLLDGLEGAAAAAGSHFDRARIDRTLSGLTSRVFLLNNVHDSRPEVFHTRFALSYLRGPLTRDQIRELARRGAPGAGAPAAAATPAGAARPAAAASDAARPLLPPDVPERFVAPREAPPAGAAASFAPALLATVRLHFADRASRADHWETLHLLAPLPDPVPADPWPDAVRLAEAPALCDAPDPSWRFAKLPPAAARAPSYSAWRKRLADSLYRDRSLSIFRAPALGLWSRPGESEGAFRGRLLHAAREERDRAVEELRRRYAPRLARLEQGIARARERAEIEREQYRHQTLQTAVSVGATVLGALFGRKAASAGTVGRATSAARGASRAARERRDVSRADERLDDLQAQLQELEAEFEAATGSLEDRLDPGDLELEERTLRPRKADLSVEALGLVWVPEWAPPPAKETA